METVEVQNKRRDVQISLVQREVSGSNPGPRIAKDVLMSAAGKAAKWEKNYAEHKHRQGSIAKFEAKPPFTCKKIDGAIASEFYRNFHYIHTQNMVGRCIHHGIFDSAKRLVGVFSWTNTLMLSSEDRDKWIGIDKIKDWRMANANDIFANNGRFCIHLHLKNRANLATQFLRLSRERIPLDWKQQYGSDLVFLETLVDTERYEGVCYKADNWVLVGKTKGANFHNAIFNYSKEQSTGDYSVKFARVQEYAKQGIKTSIKRIFIRKLYDDKTTVSMLVKLGVPAHMINYRNFLGAVPKEKRKPRVKIKAMDSRGKLFMSIFKDPGAEKRNYYNYVNLREAEKV